MKSYTVNESPFMCVSTHAWVCVGQMHVHLCARMHTYAPLCIYAFLTEGCSWVLSSPASHSGDPKFKSQPDAWLSWVFAYFLSLPRQMLGYYLKTGRNYLLPHLFQFIIHKSSYHMMLHN